MPIIESGTMRLFFHRNLIRKYNGQSSCLFYNFFFFFILLGLSIHVCEYQFYFILFFLLIVVVGCITSHWLKPLFFLFQYQFNCCLPDVSIQHLIFYRYHFISFHLMRYHFQQMKYHFHLSPRFFFLLAPVHPSDIRKYFFDFVSLDLVKKNLEISVLCPHKTISMQSIWSFRWKWNRRRKRRKWFIIWLVHCTKNIFGQNKLGVCPTSWHLFSTKKKTKTYKSNEKDINTINYRYALPVWHMK